ncbi:hypothetical protein HPB49_001788 [Dermacentor silvarum]|uniref:Uncharacterized protein n=1 Tax=Dermacentor silvarum TaxID=543639 RepID=A0ACB8C0N3_DERSI|nr:hypothetical protein HPB49_001788 [Dermacentor silvarum]
MGGKDDAKEIKDLSKQLEAFKRDMRTELRELKESVKYCVDTCDEVSELKKEFLSLSDEIKQLLKENSTLKDQNEKLTQKIEELEQYHRMNNLEIKGIPKTDKTDDVMKIFEKVGEALEESIQERGIDTCHWVPTPKPDVHNIVVRFVHRRKRDELLAKARKKWLTCKDLGLESKNYVVTVFLPCRHVLCKSCYEQCLLDNGHACPLDGEQFLEGDTQWGDFPLEKLLSRKVKCWNEDNDCEVVMAASEIHKHFYEDCVHHSTHCPKCSAIVLCQNMCAHRRSDCRTYAAPKMAQHLQPRNDSVQEGVLVAFEKILEERVGELRSGLDKVVRDSSDHWDSKGGGTPCETTVWQWNCRGYKNKHGSLMQYIATSTRPPEIIAPQETNTHVRLPGYVTYGTDTGDSLHTLVSKKLVAVQHHLQQSEPLAILLEIIPQATKKKGPMFVLNAYCRPKSTPSVLKQVLEQATHAAGNHPLLIVVDFNAAHPLWSYTNPRGNVLHKVIEDMDLTLVNDPRSSTRLGTTVTRDTNPDLTLTINIPQACWTNLAEYLGSDHALLATTLHGLEYKDRIGTARLTDWTKLREIREERATNEQSLQLQSNKDWITQLHQDPEGSQILDAQKLTIADMKSVELPSGWRMITLVSDNSSEGESVAFFTLKHGTECLQIEKSVVVNSESSATASAYGRAATAYASIPIRAVEDLTSLLKAVHKLHACEGCQRQCYACISPKCKVLSPQQTCAACRTHDKKLAREATRLRNALVDKGSRLRNLRKKVLRASAKRASFMQEVKMLNDKLRNEKSRSISQALSTLPPIQQLAFETSLKQVHAKGPKGGRDTAVAADHALVIMFIPLFEKWVQPIASFATKGAAPGFVLSKLVLESVLQLERHGASVTAVVSDGAGNNRSMWTHVGVSGKICQPVNKIRHSSLEDGRYLHFLCDVPHIMKCVRNNILAHTFAKAGSDCINFGHYRLLQRTEKEFQLKVVPKLTSSHVNPGKLEKMSVRLATQLFSRSVATGMKFCREQRYPGFEDTQGTENFTLLMNDVFDALNAKCPVAGIYKNSPKIKVIQDFLEMVNTTERTCRSDGTRTFASQMTMESLRVTLMSVLDIITLLHSKDVPYVLTAKLNQDPLERFFGVVRSFGGDEDHPTITHFSQIFRLLSLYTPLKMATKGNCTGEADPVLVAVNDSLSNEKVIALSKKEAREEQLAKVVSQIELREPVAADTLQHSYVRTTAQASALYYLGGRHHNSSSPMLRSRRLAASTEKVPPTMQSGSGEFENWLFF